MKASLIKEIEQKMQAHLSMEQMGQLHQVLENCISSNTVEEKQDLIKLFLAAKRAEGCSEKNSKVL